MYGKDVIRVVCVVALALVILVGVGQYASVRKSQIEAARAAEVRQIEREEAAVVQAQKTERTEERSQFWQKVVPWGSDEAEKNEITTK
jgi:hypothetical protein